MLDRPKTKRIGTPYLEKSRRALKRAGLETGSEVSRAKKRMIFEFADNLVAERHGEERRLPEVEQACVGEMLNALAQMAKEGSAPTCDLEKSNYERVAGTSPAAASRNDDVTLKERVLVNHQHVEGTRDHVIPCLDVGVTCEGLDACDSQMREKTKLTLHGEGSVGPLLVSGNLNSNSSPCATHPLPYQSAMVKTRGTGPPPLSRRKTWGRRRELGRWQKYSTTKGGRGAEKKNQPRTSPIRPSQSPWMTPRLRSWGRSDAWKAHHPLPSPIQKRMSSRRK